MYIQSYFIWVMYSTYEVYCLRLGLIYFSMRRNELKMYALHCTLPAETENVISFSHCYGCTLGIYYYFLFCFVYLYHYLHVHCAFYPKKDISE